MLSIDLSGKRALVAGVADDAGFGFAIAKALGEAGATVCVGTWPPALNIFLNLIERGKIADVALNGGDDVPVVIRCLLVARYSCYGNFFGKEIRAGMAINLTG